MSKQSYDPYFTDEITESQRPAQKSWVGKFTLCDSQGLFTPTVLKFKEWLAGFKARGSVSATSPFLSGVVEKDGSGDACLFDFIWLHCLKRAFYVLWIAERQREAWQGAPAALWSLGASKAQCHWSHRLVQSCTVQQQMPSNRKASTERTGTFPKQQRVK